MESQNCDYFIRVRISYPMILRISESVSDSRIEDAINDLQFFIQENLSLKTVVVLNQDAYETKTEVFVSGNDEEYCDKIKSQTFSLLKQAGCLTKGGD